MKIVYLLATTGGAWGGLEKHTFDVAGAMAARGHEVVVLADAVYRERAASGVVVQPFDWDKSRHNPLLWLRLRSALRALAPGIVHAQADKAAGILARAGWPRETVAIGTVHNVKSGYRAYRRMNAVIAVSRAIAGAVGHPDVHVVYNGVRTTTPDDGALSALRDWRAGKPGPLLLAVGRLVPAKGFDVLLQAWPPDAAATLVILGGGKQQAELEKICADRGLSHVYLQGESTQVREWMAIADLLVISSRNEGGPYTLAEALLADLPVIGTDVGMVADFLPPSCVVPAGDAARLHELLASAIAQPARYRGECAPAMRAARERLTIDAMMDATESVYLAARGKYAVAPPR